RVLPERLRQWAELGVPLVHVFGLTETTVTSTLLRLPAGGDSGERPNLPIGRPLEDAGVYVLDSGVEPVPTGVPGELCIGGPSVARGYHGRPELTAGRFVPDPFSGEPGARLYRTGDRVRRLPDGNLEFLGRTDQQVKVRGFRIEPAEIEAALVEDPAVHEAVVAVREDAPGERRLVAYVVPRGGAPLSSGELRARLRARLPEHMVPGVFVALDALPLTSNGKLDRRALPAPEARSPEVGHQPPRTAAERAVAEVWREVLRLERVGIHDNYFELGGDSILAIQVVSRARRAGLHLTPRQLFSHPTVAELARVCGSAPAGTVEAEQGAVTGPVELTPVQRWFFEQGMPEPHHWNMSEMFEVRKPLDAAALERALAALRTHHDALRLSFARAGEGWRQENGAPDGRAHLVQVDLSRIAGERQREAMERAAAQMQGSLRLEDGPLLRAGYFARGEGRSARLLVAVHHLVMDGVSWRILLEDLQTAYARARRGEPVSLPAKTTSFQGWSRRLAEHVRAGGFDAELPFWTCEARRGVAPLPLDFPGGREPAPEASARTVSVELGETETRALLQEAPRAYRAQADDVLLTALARTLAPWTGDGRLLVNLEGHGREDLFPGVDLSRTVGWFTTLYPVLLDVRGAEDEGAALKRVKEQMRAVPGRGIGYGALRYLSADPEVRARLAALPEPEVHFEYLGQFDGVLAGDSLLRVAPEPAGPAT
ncbi:MAG TPA: condensation domain-containing protein, partial [Longimicrobiaceae bacterium]|nr:condensation domain-containing protein [Longimicrobiaceae bacterium]